jgi:hypothetical protein
MLVGALSSLGCAEILGVGDFEDATTTAAAGSGGLGGGGHGGTGGTGGGTGGTGGSGIAHRPVLAWAGQLRGTGDDEVWGLDVDPSGEVGLCGPFEGTLTFDLDGTTSTTVQSAALHDIFVLKLEPDGATRWLHHFDGNGDNDCAGLAFDDQARAHVTGSLQGTVDFLGTPIVSGGPRVAYLVVFEGNGDLWRATQFEQGGNQEMFDIDVDPANTSWAAGTFRNTATFGSASITAGPSARAGLVASQTLPGARNLVGIGASGSTDDQEQWAFAVHAPSSNRILVGGRNAATITVAGTIVESDSPLGNAYVVELDGTGPLTRAVGFGSPGLSQVHAFAMHPDGDLLTVGLFTESLTVGDVPPIVGYGDWDAFILKSADDWSTSWSRALGQDGAQEAHGVAVDDSGNIYVVVNFAGTVEVGGATLTAEGVEDGLLVSYGPDGSHRFHVWMASNGKVFVSSVAVQPTTRRVSVAGYFEDTLTFYDGDTPIGDALTAEAGHDGFVAAFDLTTR